MTSKQVKVKSSRSQSVSGSVENAHGLALGLRAFFFFLPFFFFLLLRLLLLLFLNVRQEAVIRETGSDGSTLPSRRVPALMDCPAKGSNEKKKEK